MRPLHIWLYLFGWIMYRWGAILCSVLAESIQNTILFVRLLFILLLLVLVADGAVAAYRRLRHRVWPRHYRPSVRVSSACTM